MSKAFAPPPPTLRLKVDRSSLAANWRALDRMSGRANAGAAVKADCYGLGVDACVPALRDAGCTHFFVAHWSEVAAVAAHVPPEQIAVLHGPISDHEVSYAIASGAVPVINSLDQAQRWTAKGGGMCHLMVDTGINRLGLATQDLGEPVIKALEINILMSHLACADEDSPMNERQLDAFRGVLGAIDHRAASLANSAGIALGLDYAFDVTRPGLALYGGIARPELPETIRPVAQVEAAIIQARSLTPGDSVGYNAEYTASEPMRVGTVSLGYADGFMRAMGRGATLLHGGTRLPVLGKVSMDMIIVDLSRASDLDEGDWVTLRLDLPECAERSGFSQYELLTTLGNRIRP